MFLLILSVYVFNDQKAFSYTIRISFIIYMFLRLIFFKSKFSKYTIWASIFTAIMLASILWAEDQSEALYFFTWSFQVFLVCILLDSFIDSKEKLDYVLKCIIIAGVLLAARLLIETPINQWGVRRLGSEIDYNPNSLGLRLAFATLVSTYFMVKTSSRKYIFFIGSLLLASTAMLTGSRKVFLVLVGGHLLFLLFYGSFKKSYIKKIPFIISIGIIMSIIIFSFEPIYDVFGSRIESTFSAFMGDDLTTSESDTQLRTLMIIEGLNLFQNSPLIGYGIGNYGEVSGFGTYSHNNYIEMLTGVGLIGFVIYYSFYCYLLFKLTRGILYGNKKFVLPLAIICLMFINETAIVTFQSLYTQIFVMLSFVFVRLYNSEINGHLKKRKKKEE